MLTIDEKLIKSSKILSNEEEVAYEKKLKKLKAINNDDTKRALNDMMNGTLEIKQNNHLIKQVIDPPSWYDISQEINENKLTKIQLNEYNQYQKRLELRLNEINNQIKLLKTNINKLTNEIDDIYRIFDLEMMKLLADKINYIDQLYQIEILQYQLLYSLHIDDMIRINYDEKQQILQLFHQIQQVIQQKLLDLNQLQLSNQKSIDQQHNKIRILDKQYKEFLRNYKENQADEHENDVNDDISLDLYKKIYKSIHIDNLYQLTIEHHQIVKHDDNQNLFDHIMEQISHRAKVFKELYVQYAQLDYSFNQQEANFVEVEEEELEKKKKKIGQPIILCLTNTLKMIKSVQNISNYVLANINFYIN